MRSKRNTLTGGALFGIFVWCAAFIGGLGLIGSALSPSPEELEARAQAEAKAALAASGVKP